MLTITESDIVLGQVAPGKQEAIAQVAALMVQRAWTGCGRVWCRYAEQGATSCDLSR